MLIKCLPKGDHARTSPPPAWTVSTHVDKTFRDVLATGDGVEY